MRVPEEPVCIDLFRQNPVFTSLHLKSPVHVHRLSRQESLEPKVSDEISFLLGGKKKYFLTGLNELYLPMQLTV
jgi:hypothetical protein